MIELGDLQRLVDESLNSSMDEWCEKNDIDPEALQEIMARWTERCILKGVSDPRGPMIVLMEGSFNAIAFGWAMHEQYGKQTKIDA